MLSGVATDKQVQELSGRFSSGELVRMLNLIQQTAAGFTRSTSRRMDAELCVMNLCQPELVLEPDAINARITRLEDQIRSGVIAVSTTAPVIADEEEERPPIFDDNDAPPVEDEQPVAPVDEAPVGFWTDLVMQIRKELKPPAFGFFTTTADAPVQGRLQGEVLTLVCYNPFAQEMINKPDVLEVVSRKASAKLGRPIRVRVTDPSDTGGKREQMEQLLQFGRAHSDIIKIKEN